MSRSIAAYETALTVFTREAYPDAWSSAQRGLGAALFRQAETGAPNAMPRAIAAYEAALTVRTFENSPAEYASLNYGLARALLTIGRTTEGRRAAENAIRGYTTVGDTIWAGHARSLLSWRPD